MVGDGEYTSEQVDHSRVDTKGNDYNRLWWL